MKAGFYPKMAIGGMRKNGRLYVPYMITCILMVAMFYILHFLGFSGVMRGMAGGGTATDMVALGSYIMAIFATIFLFYTQSTLVKGRKKEFGLYSILGMNKRNIGKIIFWETAITGIVSIVVGLLTGIGLSKLAELGFTKLIAVPTRYEFSVSGSSVVTTLILFAVIFFFIYLNTIRQVRFANPIQLINAGKAGEKPPKANWVVGILGLVLLGAGYVLALKIEQPLSALLWFFVAVILIIIGTYLCLVAGSVILCKLLQKNKKYYYKTNHFVSVSSMAYRMKRNGASLASICILITMILVTLSSTTSLYTGAEQCLNAHYPNEIGAFACKYGYDDNLPSQGERLDEILIATSEENGATVTNNCTYFVYSISGYFENDRLEVNLNSLTNMAFIDYDKVAQIQFIDDDDYNRTFGHSVNVNPGEAILGTGKKIDIGNEVTIGEVTFKITERFDDKVSEIDSTAAGAASPTIYMIVDDVDAVAQKYIHYEDYNGEPMLAWFWYCRFDTGLDADGQIKLAETLSEKIKEELQGKGFSNYYCESHEAERGDFISTFGGLFFLGIILSIIFLVSCVVIIYYKQISEGFEDQARFGIMQKVGMNGDEIKKSVNSQMLTVFMIPIIFACVHLVVVLPIVNKLLMLFGLYNFGLLLICAGVCVLVCGLFYAFIYKVTSNAYYKIVS